MPAQDLSVSYGHSNSRWQTTTKSQWHKCKPFFFVSSQHFVSTNLGWTLLDKSVIFSFACSYIQGLVYLGQAQLGSSSYLRCACSHIQGLVHLVWDRLGSSANLRYACSHTWDLVEIGWILLCLLHFSLILLWGPVGYPELTMFFWQEERSKSKWKHASLLRPRFVTGSWLLPFDSTVQSKSCSLTQI